MILGYQKLVGFYIRCSVSGTLYLFCVSEVMFRHQENNYFLMENSGELLRPEYKRTLKSI